MRTLSSDLLAAQKSDSAVPYVRVVISDRIGGIRRLAFDRLYTGSEPDANHALAVPSDGSLVRLRTQGNVLYRQRVANPGPGADFSQWTQFGTDIARACALAQYGNSLVAFAVGSVTPTNLWKNESSDGGQTWGGWSNFASAPAAVDYIAAAAKPNGDILLIFNNGSAVRSMKRVGGVWGSQSDWTNSVASLSGLAVHYSNDFNVVVTGTDAAGEAYVWTCIYGDGFSQAADTWSPLREVTRASSGASVVFQAPFLAQPDVFRLTFVEKYSGSQSYSRPYHTFSPATADYAANLWREPIPFGDPQGGLSSDYGLAIAHSASHVWLATPAGVWQAALDVPSQEVTADVLELASDDEPFDGAQGRRLGGRLRVVLRNDDGRYSSLPDAIKLGAEVRVSPGYVTAAGPEASDGPAYWLQGWEHTSGGGAATLVLYAGDGWSLLAAWRARRQYAWVAGDKNVFQLLSFVFARAGLEFSSLGSSAAASNLYPAFTIHPGESALTAVRRLLAMVPDVIFWRGEFAFLKEPQASEASAYSYGTDHVLYSGRYGSSMPAANRIQLFGDGLFQERFDWPGIEAVYDRLRQVHDLNLTTVALADDRGDAELRQEAIRSTVGEIVVPVNCGQELYDVIDITDTAAGLSAAKRRVLGLGLRYVGGGVRPAYEQRLTLGGV